MQRQHVVTVYASRLAALCGLHRYVDPIQALVDQWYASDRGGFVRALARTGHERDIEDLALSGEELRACEQGRQAAMAAPDAASLQQTLEALPEGIVRNTVRSDAYRDRGTRDEGKALGAAERVLGDRITDRNTQLFCKTVTFDDLDTTVRIIGRIDGLRREQNEIVEVKNRARRFFDAVPFYERVQVQAYMWMTGIPRCRLVQQLDGELREDVVDVDDGFLRDKVWPELALAVEQLLPLLAGDEARQAEVLALGRLPEAYCREKNVPTW